ncbi:MULTISPECIES: DNA polymerase III subunit chi [Gammaproteobacteria]|uniref:DNA polymerase III subunit chi n=1 Tax=Gammaproteobacteria TaxID=1236 RepID=UPI0014035572|nr:MULTISPECIES: DNA polymerase III subunit chi [Gammaproteobacteria]
MAQATFYTLDTIGDEAKERFVAQLIHSKVSQRQRVLVLAESQEQAEQYDEILWQLPSDHFVPHNLIGEGPSQGTPAIIAWGEIPQNISHRHVVINLSGKPLQPPFRIQQIIELVPVHKEQREKARDNYRHYRQQQCNLANVVAVLEPDTETEGNHG